MISSYIDYKYDPNYPILRNDFRLPHAIERNLPCLWRPDFLSISSFVRSLHAHLAIEVEHCHDEILGKIS
jgi:hypothetical protein